MILGLDPYLWVMRGDLEGVNFFENLEVFVWVCIFHNQKMHVYLVFNLWICIVTGQLPFQLLNERLLSKFKCCLFFKDGHSGCDSEPSAREHFCHVNVQGTLRS